MTKVLKIKEVSSDVENRMKEFEKMRVKLKSQIDKDATKKASTVKEGKGLLKSISEFFADSPKNASK